MKAILRIKRFDPEKDRKAYSQDYEIDVQEGTTVLDGLLQVRGEQDGTLAFRRSCRSAICGSCSMMINKMAGLACYTQVQELRSKIITLEPLRGYQVIRDLVVDMEPFFAKLRAVMPYMVHKTPTSDREVPQTQEEHRLLSEAITCILCGSCSASCPRYWHDENYLGPAALLKAYRFVIDSRDEAEEERLAIVNDPSGVFRCRKIFNCVEACPKKINSTEAITALSRKILSKKF